MGYPAHTSWSPSTVSSPIVLVGETWLWCRLLIGLRTQVVKHPIRSFVKRIPYEITARSLWLCEWTSLVHGNALEKLVNNSTLFFSLVRVNPTINTPKPANCKLSPWLPWSECRGTCSRGGRFRLRTILQKGEHGGKQCPEIQDLIKWRRCKLPRCPSEKANGKALYSSISNISYNVKLWEA